MIGEYARVLSIVVRGISRPFFLRVHGCDHVRCYTRLVGYPHDGYEMGRRGTSVRAYRFRVVG